MIPTHGGILIDQVATKQNKELILQKSYQKIAIGDRYVSDCEMIAIGAFSPLTGVMTKAQAKSVVDSMRLPSDLLWPIPILRPIAFEKWNAFLLDYFQPERV
ncbi:MAG: sulfate adenylyltransferase [Candidatus Woesearchaeota archaeon]|jgi:sulfate adenylyltransferase